MSKFLKFIVHFIVICTIICVVALAVPPFLGVTTEIMDDSGKETNLALGSVTYAIPKKTEEVSVGTPILVTGESGVSRYNIVSLDVENHTGTVIDPNAANAETVNVAVKNYVPEIVITIPYLGYLLIATESIEGLIILGLAVLFLIILYVIAELWKKDSSDEYDDDDDETYVKSTRELKREEKERERRMKEEDRQMLRDEKKRKKEEKKQRKIIKTGGFVDEVYEDELDDDVEEEQPKRRANVQTATSEAHELLKKEIAAATAEENEKPGQKPAERAERTEEKPRKSARPKGQPVKEEAKPVEVKKMAIPIRSAAQLADIARKQGDAPDIVKDEITKVTLFDYSDIIGEVEDDYEEE